MTDVTSSSNIVTDAEHSEADPPLSVFDENGRIRSFRLEVNPAVIEWALRRSGIDVDEVRAAQVPWMKPVRKWLDGETQPTYKQLLALAKRTNVPLGHLLRETPWPERLPIDDFRTKESEGISAPSGNLLDTIYACQNRQEWYRDYIIRSGEEPLEFVDSWDIGDDPNELAETIRNRLDWSLAPFGDVDTWEGSVKLLRDRIEEIGVLVMMSSYVGNNTRRSLDPDEFRGFALSDPYAPLIFVNTKDSFSAQMFTLVHELAHLYLGNSAISVLGSELQPTEVGEERWCNSVAAEMLVPAQQLRAHFSDDDDARQQVVELARSFRVSRLAVIYRLSTLKLIPEHEREALLKQEREAYASFLTSRKASSGGSYYHTKIIQVSPQFSQAVICEALEGKTLYTDAMDLLGVRNLKAFSGLATRLGVPGFAEEPHDTPE